MHIINENRGKPGRAWVEVDLDAIAHNAAAVRSLMGGNCDLMAIVKADAYGHGAVRASERLYREGVRAFAVATLDEGLTLRESGLDGDILVLGYTEPSDAHALHDFKLTQLVVDGAYAGALGETGKKLDVHIAVDTGMHRLGIAHDDLREIEGVYGRGNLAVKGVATHLAASDSLDDEDVEFSEAQLRRFGDVVSSLRGAGLDTGKLHAQASYGVCNFSSAGFDYARVGVMLYGVMSHFGEARLQPALMPALSFRAVIAQVREIEAGETVSYGRAFTAERPMMLATVCAGYADGAPRQASGRGLCCIVHGHRVPVVGRICMDMLMADVTGVDDVKPGDVATLIGADGGEVIRCEEVARASGTITNDILCRLGGRLPRVYV